MSETYNWKGALTRQEAIRIIGRDVIDLLLTSQQSGREPPR